jgi:hypothetical protein
VAACGDGAAEPVARLDQLRLNIVQGQGIRDTVRAEGDPADARTSLPVVVRVYADAGRSVQVLPGATGPALEARIPPVEIAWRTLDPWCQPERERSTITRGDTAAMHLRLPTVARICRLVAEGVLDGNVFGTDTALVDFHPGPLATFQVPPLIVFPEDFKLDVRLISHDAKDRYGNDILAPGITWTLAAGAPLFTLDGLILHAPDEGTATLQASAIGQAQTTAAWTVTNLVGAWRLSWACYGARLADGAYADSAHFTMQRAEAYYGSLTGRGLAVSFRGPLATRTWVRGGPVREASAVAATRFAAQRPRLLEWSPGQVAERQGPHYAGGSLCEAPPRGSAWTGFAPARAERLP